MGDNKKMSVGKYFQQEYKYQLKYPKQLTLHVGNPTRNILLPLELVKLKKQVCPRSKELTGKQTAQMIRQGLKSVNDKGAKKSSNFCASGPNML